MRRDLLSRIESDFNTVCLQLISVKDQSTEHAKDLLKKKKELQTLASEYVQLEGKYKEVMGLKLVF